MAALVFRILPLLFGVVVSLAALGAAADAPPQRLRVLAWPGYADADIVKGFEQLSGSKVDVTFIDSDEVMWQRLGKNQAQDFDVFAVNTAELQRYVAAGLVAPLQVADIANTARQLPQFRDLSSIPGLVHGGTVVGIPYTYAEMGLIFDRQQIKEPPDTIRALWDPLWRGKVLLYNGGTHNFSLAAQAVGLSNPFQIDGGQWTGLVAKLIALRRNALGFYTQPDESVAQFKSGKAALMLANYGSQQVQLLKAAGLDVGYAIPKEGALAWLDCWSMTKAAKNPKLVHEWISYMLDTKASNALISRQGLSVTTVVSPHMLPGDHLKWLEPVEDSERRDRLWERIYAGDRANRVLAP